MMKMSLHRRAAALSGLVAALTAAIAGGLAPVASQTQSTPPQCLTAAETHFRGRSGGIESFNNIISRQPMRFGELLGRSHSEIMPDEQLAIAEEYRDDEVRYTAFFGLDFCARTWDFLSKDSCIGGFSHLVVFFNRGHAFRVRAR